MGKVSLQFWITNRIMELEYFTLCSCCSPICTAHTHTLPPPLLSLSLPLSALRLLSFSALFPALGIPFEEQMYSCKSSWIHLLHLRLPLPLTLLPIFYSPPSPLLTLSPFLCPSPCLPQFVTLIVTRFSSRLDLT